MVRVSVPRLLATMAVAAATAIAAAPAVHAQQGALRVEHVGQDTVTVDIGERGSIAFRLSNDGQTAVAGTVDLTVPEGWRATGSISSVEVPAGSSMVRVATFYPENAPAGIYPLRMAFRAGTAAIAEDLVYVRVPEQRELELTVEEAPQWSTAGEPFAVSVRVANIGNVTTRFTVELTSPYEIPAYTETTTQMLEPGASTSVLVEVRPPADLPLAVQHAMTIAAVADSAIASVVSRVEILPGADARREARRGLPAEIRFRASADPRAGPPVRFEAAGPIRPGSDTRVVALLQGPSRAYSMFGETDIYRLAIQSPDFSLELGDNYYRLSRLTEPGEQGLGIGGSARLGFLSAGGFVLRDRRSFSPDTQYAAFAGIHPTKHLSLRANWLRNDSRSERREVVSGELSFRVPNWLTFQSELGMRPSNDAVAHSAELALQRGPFTLSLRHLDGDTAFGGINAGLSTGSAHLNVRPWRSLYFEGSLQEQTAAQLFASGAFSSSSRSARVAAGWGTALSLEGQTLQRTFRTSDTLTSQSARSVGLRFGLPLGLLTLYPSIETGIGETNESPEKHPFWRAGARVAISAGPLTLSSNLEYFTGGTLHRSVEEEGLAGTAAANLNFGSTEIRLSAHGTRYLEPLQRENLVMDIGIDHELPFGHTISGRLMSRASTGLFQHNDVIAMLDYSIPLKLPTWGRGRDATMTGRIYDAATGAPLSDVIVEIGNRRVATDRNGRLRVEGLDPGVHYVDIDRSTTAAGRVTSVTLPMRIELDPGERESFDLALLSAGGIAVETSILRATSASGLGGAEVSKPLERVVVDFRLGEQRIRRESDALGMIHVGDLRPGVWSVEIAGADLPPFHRWDRDSLTMEVSGGAETLINFTAAPVQRRVDIVASANLVEQSKAEADASEKRSAPTVDVEINQAAPQAIRVAPDTAISVSVSAATPALTVPSERTAIPAPTARPQGITIEVIPGDRSLRNIAVMVYGNRKLWPRIWLANLDAVPNPDRVLPGLVLRIPPGGPLTDQEKAILRRYPEPSS